MSSKSTDTQYTKPDLRERLKERIKQSDRGGREGQWSARKSQLLVQEYEKQGGGYKGAKGEKQKSLEKWTKEKWQTKDGTVLARKGDQTKRYLPEKAWKELSPAERRATDAKKQDATRKGKQFVANTQAARKARRSATKK